MKDKKGGKMIAKFSATWPKPYFESGQKDANE